MQYLWQLLSQFDCFGSRTGEQWTSCSYHSPQFCWFPLIYAFLVTTLVLPSDILNNVILQRYEWLENSSWWHWIICLCQNWGPLFIRAANIQINKCINIFTVLYKVEQNLFSCAHFSCCIPVLNQRCETNWFFPLVPCVAFKYWGKKSSWSNNSYYIDFVPIHLNKTE